MNSHVRDLWNGQKIKSAARCCSLVRLTWPVGSAWAISVFSGLSSLQAGEVGTLSARLSGRLRATHHANREDFLEESFWKVKVLTELHLL